MWRPVISNRIGHFWSGIFSLRWLKCLFSFGAYQRWICWYPSVPLKVSIITLLHLGNTTASGDLGVACLYPSLDISGKLCLSPPALVPLFLYMLLEEHVKGQFRVLILVAHLLDGGSLVSHSSLCGDRHSLAQSHHKRSHCGCFSMPYAPVVFHICI